MTRAKRFIWPPEKRWSRLLEKRVGQAIEQRRQRLAVKCEGAGIGRPRELKASRHRRDPDLPYRRVGRDHELGLDRLLEDDVEHAVLQLDLEPFAVGERQQTVAR